MVLLVVSILTTIAVGLAYRTRVELRLAESRAQGVKAYHLALGGLARAIVACQNQEPNAVGSSQLGWFTQTAALEDLFGELPTVESETYKLATLIRDEQGCLNLNGQSADRLESLLGRDSAACLLDWVDDNNDTRGYEGADSDYYQELAHPYRAKNEAFEILRELLYVKGSSTSSYRGDWLNAKTLFENEALVGGIALDVAEFLYGEPVMGLAGMLTVYGDDLININTACPQVLAALGGLEEGVIEALYTHRAGGDALLGTEDDEVFGKSSDLHLPGLTDVERSVLTDTSRFCFSSKHFRVYTLVENEGRPYCLMASLDCQNQPRIVALERLL